MALGLGASIFILILLLALFYFLLRLTDSFNLNRHRKKYKDYDDPSRKGGEFKDKGFGVGISNLEGERIPKGQFLLPSAQIESRATKGKIIGVYKPDLDNDKRKSKKFRILRRKRN